MDLYFFALPRPVAMLASPAHQTGRLQRELRMRLPAREPARESDINRE